MINSPDKPLQILSASAGSGKTYRLVLTYLELLFVSEKSEPFAHIVAMTFTNKAAAEMKTRIIEALEIMSFPDQFPKEKRKYETVLSDSLQISPEKLQKQSREILLRMLHRYEDFKVLTIDKFNLRLIRSFAKELDLPADFEVIIKEDEVLENVVDQLLNDVGNDEHHLITQLVLTYAKVKLEEGEKWNFRKDLIDFLGILKSEKHQASIEKLTTYEFTNEDFRSLQKAITVLRENFISDKKEFLNYLDSMDIWSDPKRIAGGLTTLKTLSKLKQEKEPQKEFLTDSCLEKLCEGSDKIPPIPTLPEKLLKFKDVYLSISRELDLLLSVRNNYHNMWLLQLLAVRLEKMRMNDSLIRISEFNQLISQLVQNEEAPFLYERLGNRYDHYLLDEFQDTSRMQWLNLVPLVHEGIAKANLNFIVGDPKQSIYRFKNGIAEQFVVLPKIYNPESDPIIAEKSNFFERLGEKNQIKQNWRSTKTIVEFNNTIFQTLGNRLPEETKDFYEDVLQESVSDEVGYVYVQLFDKKVFPDTKSGEITQLITWIEEVKSDGFLPKDITILGRRNEECNRWATHLIAAGYKVISADSLFVNSDIIVQWIIAYLDKRKSPSIENVSKKFISQTLLVKRMPLSSYEEYLVEVEGKKYKALDELKFINDFFFSEKDFYFNYQSIFDLIAKFCDLVKINPLDNHYVHHLLDMAFQFDLRFGPDLQLFLEQYKQNGYKSPVQLPDSDDALTILSIHKSKGLEFPVVLLPNLSMGDPKRDKQKYYVEIEGRPSILNGDKTAKIKGYEHFLEVEANQIKTDNLNMFYVACTRAINRLYLRSIDQNTKEEEGKFVTVIQEEFPKNWNEDKTILTFGERLPKKMEEKTGEQKYQEFTPLPLRDFLWFPSIALEKTDRQEEYTMSEAQVYGNQFHLLLSVVENQKEIDLKLNELIAQGEIDFHNKERISSEAKALFANHLNKMYEAATEILSEKKILFEGEKHSRPDKILIRNNSVTVIDFKTGEPRKSHEKQILKYGELLSNMGYQDVKKGLLYTEVSEMIWVD